MSVKNGQALLNDFLPTVYRVDSALRMVSESLWDDDDDRMQGACVVLDGIAALLMREAQAQIERAGQGGDHE